MIKDNQVFGTLDFNKRKVLNGEEATPSTFNRPLLGSIDADSKLDQSIQFTDRSIGLLATKNTSFLAHFDKGLETEISPIEYTTVGQMSDCFNDDGNFRGQFWSFKAGNNLLAKDDITDTSLTSLKGWVVNGVPNSRCVVRATTKGTHIRNYLKGGSIAGGILEFVSKVPYDVTSLPTKVISCALKVLTNSDLDISKTQLHFGFLELDSSSVEIHRHLVSLDESYVKGMLKIENVVLDPLCKFILPLVYFTFDGPNSLIDLTIKDFMVVNETYVGGYSPSTNAGSGIIFKSCVNIKDEQGSIVIKGVLNANYANVATNKYGPLFLVDEITNKGFGLIVERNTLTLYHLDFSSMSILSAGNPIPLDPQDFEYYNTFAIRYGKDINEVQGIMVNKDGKVKISRIHTLIDQTNRMHSICLGAFCLGVADFEAPLTELRYDREWVNDQQLQVMNLSTMAFIDSSTSVLTKDDISGIIDSVGINMLPNPDGRLWLNHWYDRPGEDKFTNVIGSNLVGSGFKWIGGFAINRLFISSEFISINPEKMCRLRCKMVSDSLAFGRFGVGFQYYSAPNAASVVGSFVEVYSDNGGSNDYYSCTGVPPSNATHARVFMIVDAGFSSKETYWSRLKFEQGDAFTVFTDESLPKYAVYR